MKVKFEKNQFAFEEEPHYIKYIKKHWWSRWKIVIDGNHPMIFRKFGNELRAVL